MKKLITTLSLLSACFCSQAQTVIYTQNFNTGSASDWSLNTTDNGSVNTITGNQWMINNSYAAGPLGTVTADEPSGISGSPESYYMHINAGPLWTSFYGSNCNFLAGGTGQTYFAAQSTPVSTTGQTNVTFSFWWLCQGDATCTGNIYYRTASGGAWTQITTAIPSANFYGSSTWTRDSVHLAAFDNQAFLEFGFQFTDGTSSAGTDPAFGIDDIMITASTGTATPVASFTGTATTACQDSCITFTSTSTGTIDSMRWTAPGATIGSGTTSSTNICFPNAGPITVTLTVYAGGVPYSSPQTINVTPTPHPVITNTGSTLSVPAIYSFYQWVNGSTPITGANTNTYTYTASGSYTCVVDSAGCYGYSSPYLYNPAHIAPVSAAVSNYWVAQLNANSISLNASQYVDEPLSITMFDATGRMVINDTWSSGTYSKQLNDLALAHGLYIIKLSNAYTSVVLKWQKK